MTTLDIHTPRATATSTIGEVTLQGEIVYRCEGWVPRFTLRDTFTGAVLGGDTRFRHAETVHLLTRYAGADERTAGAIVCALTDQLEGML